MKSRFLIYILPVLLVMALVYGYSTQNDPRLDAAPQSTTSGQQSADVSKLILTSETDTLVPAGFPVTLWNYNFSTNPSGQSAGSVGATYFGGKYINNRWNLATLYRLNPDGQNGGAGTIADSNTAYNGGTGAIRDMTTAPDGSGTMYLWGGAASTALYKMDENGNRIATYTHAGAAYRTIAWDPNRKGFWSSNFSDNLVCRDTNGVILKTLVNTLPGKYGMAFDSTSAADSSFLWVWSQGATTGAPNTLNRIHIESNTNTKIYTVPLVGGTLGIAGGAETYVKDNKFMLNLNYQNYAIVGYVLKELGPPPPINCVYNYYEQPSGVSALLYSVSAVSDRIGWTAGAGAVVRKTTDGGTSWLNANPNPGVIVGDIYNINAWSANDAIITTSPSSTFIYKTSNGGANWTQVYSLAGGFMDAIQMVSPTEGYAVGDPVGGKWVVLKTTDGGSTWNRMATEPTQIGTDAGYNNSFSIVGTNMWFGSTAGTIYHSTDLGLTWNFVTAPGVSSVFAVHFNSDLVGMAGGLGPNMVKSSDGGVTFTPTNVPASSGGLVGISGLNNDIWTVREGTSIYRTTNMGGTWTTGITVATADLKDIDVKNIGGCAYGWSVGATGKLIRVDGNTVGISSNSSEVPETYYLQQNYPNPFNPTTNISFSIPSSGFVTMKVYNMAGMEVAKLLNENKTAGSYTIGFDAANLPSGAYFYRLETNSFTDTKKMILLK
jgi:photosystem II stability/assembly factor-like uncharacterized protein